MLLTVFGAGASFDSVPHVPVTADVRWRPPLASQLFEQRFAGMLSIFKRCEPIVPFLTTPGASVEQLLQQYLEEASDYPDRHCQLMAVRYYLQYMIWECETQWGMETRGTSNYATLVDQMNRWTPRGELIQLVTFNYDRLLESALKAFGVKLSALSDYSNHYRFRITKLHGSVDSGRELELGIDENNPPDQWKVVEKLIEDAPALRMSERYALVDHRPAYRSKSALVTPAIALPTERGKPFECPKEQLEQLVANIPRLRQVLFIGWRAADNPLLDLLARHQSAPLNVLVVAGGSTEGQEVSRRVAAAEVKGECAVYDGGFSDFVVSRAGESFFRS